MMQADSALHSWFALLPRLLKAPQTGIQPATHQRLCLHVCLELQSKALQLVAHYIPRENTTQGNDYKWSCVSAEIRTECPGCPRRSCCYPPSEDKHPQAGCAPPGRRALHHPPYNCPRQANSPDGHPWERRYRESLCWRLRHLESNQ